MLLTDGIGQIQVGRPLLDSKVVGMIIDFDLKVKKVFKVRDLF